MIDGGAISNVAPPPIAKVLGKQDCRTLLALADTLVEIPLPVSQQRPYSQPLV